MDASGHDARYVHGVDQGDEAVSGDQAVGGLQGHHPTQSPRVTSGTTRI